MQPVESRGPAAAAEQFPLPVALGLLLLSGAGFAYGLGLQRAFLDSLPEQARGQAFGLLSSGLMTAQGLGPAAFGAMALVTGAPAAVALAGATTTALHDHRIRRYLPSGSRTDDPMTGDEGLRCIWETPHRDEAERHGQPRRYGDRLAGPRFARRSSHDQPLRRAPPTP